MTETWTWEAWRRAAEPPDRHALALAIVGGAIGSLRAAGFGQEEILALFAETARAPDASASPSPAWRAGSGGWGETFR